MNAIFRAMKVMLLSVATLAAVGAQADTEIVDGITWTYRIFGDIVEMP